MVKRNIVVALIIIILFIVLAIAGYLIVFISRRVRFPRNDEEAD